MPGQSGAFAYGGELSSPQEIVATENCKTVLEKCAPIVGVQRWDEGGSQKLFWQCLNREGNFSSIYGIHEQDHLRMNIAPDLK